jgi:alkylation response protein AidB-like acyl-CoA dehydrogenase
MALVLTEEQSMLRDSARDFLSGTAPIAHLRQLRDSRDETGFSRELLGRFTDMGFTGMLIPEAHGGLGLGYVEAGLLMEEVGRNLTPSPFLASSAVAATAIATAGSEAQKQALLPQMASGSLLVTLASDETGKHRPSQVALRAERQDGGFSLSGAKTFVLDGHVADKLIVAARTSGSTGDTNGITLFIVDRTAPGVSVERTVMVDAHNAARVGFDGVTVLADAVLGEEGQGWAVLEATLDAGRALVAAELLGIAQESFDRTVAYLKERQQFGKTIGEFQALQHRAAALYCDIEFSRATVLAALQALDGRSEDVKSAVSIAKAHAGKTATVAVQEAVQMHGGMGMTDDFDVGLFMKRARVAQELFGDTHFHAERLARLRSY